MSTDPKTLSTLLGELDALVARMTRPLYLRVVEQLDGNVRIDDAIEDAPFARMAQGPTEQIANAKAIVALVNAYSALKKGIEQLAQWKAEALAVEAQWDVQAVGRAIGAPLGADIRPLILPAIERLERENKRLRAVVKCSAMTSKPCPEIFDREDWCEECAVLAMVANERSKTSE